MLLNRISATVVGLALLASTAVVPALAQQEATPSEPAPAEVAPAPEEATPEPAPEEATPEPAPEEATPEHAIICKGNAYTPQRQGDRITGLGTVSCNDEPDIQNISVQLQRFEGGDWKNYGAPQRSSTPRKYTSLEDWVNCPGTGRWSYRTKLFYEGFHGTWSRDEKPSKAFYTSC